MVATFIVDVEVASTARPRPWASRPAAAMIKGW
jgi:hypothetical protein